MSTLDLSGTITREQYMESVQNLTAFLRELSRPENMDWCSRRHRHFRALLPEYDRDLENNVDAARVPIDTDYAQRLSQIRRRILWFANQGNVTVRQANDGLRAMGLPEYETPVTEGTRFDVYLPVMSVTISGDEEEARQWTMEHIQSLIVAALNGETFPDSHYVRDTIGFRHGDDVEVYSLRPGVHAIPESDVEVPVYE